MRATRIEPTFIDNQYADVRTAAGLPSAMTGASIGIYAAQTDGFTDWWCR